MQAIIKFLETQPKSVQTGLWVFSLLFIGAIDYLIPSEVSTTVFYLLPIALAAWFSDRKIGIFISGGSGIVWFTVNCLHKKNRWLDAIAYWNLIEKFALFLIFTYIISELSRALDREGKLVRTDEITDVANKRFFIELANMEIKKSRRYGHPFTVAYIDLDDFKSVNDQGGQKIGDFILKTVAQTIKVSIRETDILARLGGDEFALLLPGLAYEPAHIVISRVRNKLIASLDKEIWPLTFSIGAITFINPPESVDEIIEKSDYLMYCIKNNGKNLMEHITEM